MELKTKWKTDHNNPATDGRHTASSELIDGETIDSFAERHLDLVSALADAIKVRNPGPLPGATGDPPVVAAGPGIDLQAAEKVASLKRERGERQAQPATETADDPPVQVEAQPVPGESKPVELRRRRRGETQDPEVSG